MFARACTRWVGALVIALTVAFVSMTAAKASPAQSPCTGCLASSGPNPTLFSTGLSCGFGVGLRFAITNFDASCVVDPTGAACVQNDPRKFTISLFYISRCQATLAQGSTCGAFPVPFVLPPTAVWTLVATYTRAIDCGDFCDFTFSIRCINCTAFGANVGARLKCSSCP